MEWREPVTAERFWANTTRIETGCLITLDSSERSPYGTSKVIGIKDRLSSRVAWILANRRNIPPRGVITHDCDRPGCVEPTHLRLGSYSSNSIEAHLRIIDHAPVAILMQRNWADPEWRAERIRWIKIGQKAAAKRVRLARLKSRLAQAVA